MEERGEEVLEGLDLPEVEESPFCLGEVEREPGLGDSARSPEELRSRPSAFSACRVLWLGEWERLWESDRSLAVSDRRISASLAGGSLLLDCSEVRPPRPSCFGERLSSRCLVAGDMGRAPKLPSSQPQHRNSYTTTKRITVKGSISEYNTQHLRVKTKWIMKGKKNGGEKRNNSRSLDVNFFLKHTNIFESISNLFLRLWKVVDQYVLVK